MAEAPTRGMATLRMARLADIPRLQEIERHAATRFAAVGLPAATELPIIDAGFHAAAIGEDRVLVVLGGDDVPVAFAIIEPAGGAVHLREIDVVPEARGLGLGRRLIERIIADARAAGARAVTLTTFRDVPFNGPYYMRLGFRVVDEAADQRLAAIRAAERAAGIDIAPRVAMALDLAPAEP
jgi:GNAT superfamily N-acetyltransferase